MKVFETKFSASLCFISQRVHDKKDLYNLNEDEELTHYGQSLAEMEKFNDLMNSDDESEEKGLLSGECFSIGFLHKYVPVIHNYKKKAKDHKKNYNQISQNAKSHELFYLGIYHSKPTA